MTSTQLIANTDDVTSLDQIAWLARHAAALTQAASSDDIQERLSAAIHELEGGFTPLVAMSTDDGPAVSIADPIVERAIEALSRIADGLLECHAAPAFRSPSLEAQPAVGDVATIIEAAHDRDDVLGRVLDHALDLFRPSAAAIVKHQPLSILHSRNRGIIDGRPGSDVSMHVLASCVLEELASSGADSASVSMDDPVSGGVFADAVWIAGPDCESLALVLCYRSGAAQTAREHQPGFTQYGYLLRESSRFQFLAGAPAADHSLLSALNEATLAAASTHDLPRLYESVREALSRVVATDAMLIATIPPGAEDAVCVFRSERTTSYFDPVPLSHPFQTGMKMGRPFIVDEVPEHLYSQDYRFGDPSTRVRSLAGAPLVAHGNVTGLIVVQSYAPRAFSIEHANLLLNIGRSIAAAIERAELIERRRAQSVRERALRSVSERLSAALNPLEQLEIVVAEMHPALGDSLIVAIGQDDTTLPASVRVAVRGPADLRRTMGIDDDSHLLPGGIASLLLEERASGVSMEDGLAISATPMLDESVCVGTIVLARASSVPFSTDEQATMATLGGAVASALRSARLYRERQRDEQDLIEVERISRLVASSLDTDTILKDIMETIPQLFLSEGCSVRVVDDGHLVPLAVYGEIVHSFAERIPIESSLAGTVVRDKQLIAVDDLHAHPVTGEYARATGVEVRGWLAAPMLDSAGEVFGILSIHSDYPRSWTERDEVLLRTLAGSTTIAIQNAWRFSRTRDVLLASVESLANAVDAKDPTTLHHSRNVSAYARQVAEAMDCPVHLVESVALAGLMHDIGKIGIPDRILQKPDVLDDSEWEHMKTHPVIGEQILSGNEHLAQVLPLVRHHHERWDGGGYPDGLQGDQIPLGASIVALADAVDTMASDRPYSKALPWATVCEIVREQAGAQFHPEVARCFLDLAASGEVVQLRPAEGDAPRTITVDARAAGHSLDVQALMIFHGVAREIRALTDLETFIANITEVIRGVMEISDVQIFLLDERRNEIVYRATEHDRQLGRHDIRRKVGQGVVGWVTRHGVPLNVPDVLIDNRFISHASSSTRSELAVPLIADGSTIGAINIESNRAAAFSESDERLLTITAAHIAQTVHLARLHDRFKQLALTDGLTGLPNHRAFYERLEDEIRHASDTGGLLTVAIMDVDALKKINDTHGHLAGDMILRRIAKVLRDRSRSTGLVARYGGDEFAFILPNTGLAGARRAVAHIVEGLYRASVTLDEEELLLPTGAWGLAAYPEDGLRSAELIRVADQRMYAHKRVGKVARVEMTLTELANGTHG